MIKDHAQRLSPTERDDVLVDAVKQFQRRVPRVVVKEVAGSGGFDYDLPAGYVDGFSTILRILYPFDAAFQDPDELETKDWEIFRREGATKLRFREHSPGPSEKFLVAFTAPHTADPAGQVDVVGTLSPAGTIVAGPSTSSAVGVETAKDARVFLDVSVGAGQLDAFVQLSEDGAAFFDVDAFNPVAGPAKLVAALEKHKVSKFVRLRYEVAGGPFTLKAVIEREGVDGTLTVQDEHLDVLSMLSAALASRALANFYAGTGDSELRDDATDYAGKSAFFSDLADKWQARYDDEVEKLAPQEQVVAYAQGDWDMNMSSGAQMLTHDRRQR